MAITKTARPFICAACRQHLPSSPRRPLTTTSAKRADNDPETPFRPFADPTSSPPKAKFDALETLSRLSPRLNRTHRRGSRDAGPPTDSISAALDAPATSSDSLLTDAFASNLNAAAEAKPHRMHVYATKHNTHITFVQPPRAAAQTMSSAVSRTSARAADQNKMVDVLLSLSTGNLGFRKAGRGSYDAAYQLAAFTLKQMQEKGMLRDMEKLEVVLRGFGAGREAVTKALLGSEGRAVRGRITAVMDSTRLKIGGARAKKPRRLG